MLQEEAKGVGSRVVETARVPRQERGRQRVAALLQAASEIFVEKGYDAATMTEIAARAKASIGSLYQFFPTKELLADALRRNYGNALIDDMARMKVLDTKTPEELANRFIQDFLDFITGHPAWMVIAGAQPATPEHRNNIRQRQYEQITRALLTKAPHLPQDQVRRIATTIQQILKTAFFLTQDVAPEDQPTALADLKEMLGMYLSKEVTPW